MLRKIDLIYCGVGNEKLDQYAIMVGMIYGARLPIKRDLPFEIHFADQDWKNPDLDKYVAELKQKKPKDKSVMYTATVLDWEREDQRSEVFEWLDEVSKVVDRVIVIPKLPGIIDSIPCVYNGKPIVLGYSVPTKYGATTVDIAEFVGRPVHLLGGDPQKQLELYDRMDVVSVDCNYTAMKATNFCEFWTNKRDGEVYNDETPYTRKWMAVKDVIGRNKEDSIYTAFFLSCINVVSAWNKKVGGMYYDI
jgi:hypothetical protein